MCQLASQPRLDSCPVWLVAATLLVAGCQAESFDAQETPQERAAIFAEDDDDDGAKVAILDGREAVSEAFARGTARFQTKDGSPFWRVGLRFDALEGDPELELRVLRDGAWTAWEPVPITFRHRMAYNAGLHLEGPGDALELRGDIDDAELSFLLVDLFDAPLPELPEDPQARDVAPASPYVTSTHALSAPSFVNPRSSWGARSTGTCGSVHSPRYVTIHNTATPTNDPMTPQERMRQMQSYHIDQRGWCDIGYHFVISADGRIWQGRATHERTGAHVLDHNTNNVGISFMGTYTADAVPETMMGAGRQMVDWLLSSYGIPRDRVHLKGHREWSGQTTTCPGDRLANRLGELLHGPSGDLPPGCTTGASFGGAFCDDEGHWAEPDIDYVAARDVTDGCAPVNGKPAYCPQTLTHRAAAITMLGRIAGMPLEGHPQIFTDLAGFEYAVPYANAAAAFGITSGCEAGAFCPARIVTRTQMAVFIARTWALPAASNDYFDDDTGVEFEALHNRVAEAGITMGCEPGKFCGGREVTRAEVATLLARAHRLGLPPLWELPPACLEGAAFDPAFCDDDAHWAEPEIDDIASRSITSGCGTLFEKPIYCPDAAATRAAAIVMLGRASGMPTDLVTDPFDDLDGWDSVAPYANAARALGITNGCSADAFCPWRSVSRSALASFVAATWALPAATADYFDDDAGSAYEEAHNRIAEAGITTGCGTRAFCGDREATRAVLAVFISNALATGLPTSWQAGVDPSPIVPSTDGLAIPTVIANGEEDPVVESSDPMQPITKEDTDSPSTPDAPVPPGDPTEPTPTDDGATDEQPQDTAQSGGAGGGCSLGKGSGAGGMTAALAVLLGLLILRRRRR